MSNNSESIIKLAVMKNIKDFRTENKISQQQIADLFGIDRSTYSSWETGRSMPNISQLVTLARIYNTTIEKLINDNSRFVVACGKGGFSGTYLNELTEEERNLVLKYRALDCEKKEELIGLIEKDI